MPDWLAGAGATQGQTANFDNRNKMFIYLISIYKHHHRRYEKNVLHTAGSGQIEPPATDFEWG